MKTKLSNKKQYEFVWNGKEDALREVQGPCNKVLTMCREKSIFPDKSNNIYIEGNNVDALKLLNKDYAGKIRVVYIDPPYQSGIYDEVLSLVKGNIIIVEHSEDVDFSDFTTLKQKKYGNSTITYLTDSNCKNS